MAQKNITLGLVAHVDSGKTTLTEAMLVGAGALRQAGRVDHGDAFLDTHALERSRGITIFAKEARLTLPHTELTLLDTPGHADFGAEMERTLSVLDYALLIISGTDGVQAHTETLWRLLERYRLPVFIFINKMDRPGADRDGILENLQQKLSPACLPADAEEETLALCNEGLMQEYLEGGTLTAERLAAAVARREWFPCFWGAALRQEGITGLLEGLDRLTLPPAYLPDFAARVYKISTDPQGNRLTHLKVTGGTLRVRMALPNGEKITQIRLYNGAKYQTAEEIPAGTVAAVTGLTRTRAGEGLGAAREEAPPLLEPVISCRVVLPEGADPRTALAQLRQLAQEDPQLYPEWEEQKREIRVRLMGEIQREILQSVAMERFGLAIGFEEGSILYKETIAAPVEGVGHFEPLRHYAEVHLLLEPLPQGSGLVFDSRCSEDLLDRNWQRLILTHLAERTHRGVLTGAPITDLRITLLSGRAHPKHTEGGDFRQATYRAVRQGLMQAESVLLEPWYAFTLTLPAEQLGRAISDLQSMAGTFDPPESDGTWATLTGTAPVAAMKDYPLTVAAYTRGRGKFACSLHGYAPCHNQKQVVAAAGYDPEGDLEHTPDSVFCAHGGGFSVKWDQVPQYMHLESALPKQRGEDPAPVPRVYTRNLDLDEKELEAIFLRTFGPQRRREYQFLGQAAPAAPRRTIAPPKQQYLIVDGYNMIFAWDALKDLARENLDAARQRLMDILSNYQGYKQCRLVLVFDGYKVKGNPGTTFDYHHIHVVYTKQDETGDMFIEKLLQEIGRNYTVRVATSDGLIQLSALRAGVLRLSADELWREVEWVGRQIDQVLQTLNQKGRLSRDS